MVVSENSMTLSTPIPSIGMTFAAASARIIELVNEVDSMPGGDEANDRRDELHHEWSGLRDEVFSAEIQTAADVLAVLDILLHPSIGLTAGLPCGEEVRAVQQIRAVVAASLDSLQPANDADAFAATVGLFDDAGPATLSIPQHPNDAMAEAGAAAVGITPEQFRASYAAAIEAFKKGEAA